jgi:hypothetical protein
VEVLLPTLLSGVGRLSNAAASQLLLSVAECCQHFFEGLHSAAGKAENPACKYEPTTCTGYTRLSDQQYSDEFVAYRDHFMQTHHMPPQQRQHLVMRIVFMLYPKLTMHTSNKHTSNQEIYCMLL